MRIFSKLLILVLTVLSLTACKDAQIKNHPIQVIYYTFPGDNSVSPVNNVKVNDKLEVPTEPERIGFRFVMWSKTIGQEDPWNFDTMVVTESMTLYAIWEAGNYTIEYNLNGGSFTQNQTPVYEFDGNKTEFFQTPTRTGYDFGGWYPKPIEEVSSGEPRLTSTEGVNNDLVLYAKWTAKRILVQFYANTGDVTGLSNPQARQVSFDSIIDFPTLSHPDYNFLGWFDTAGNEYVNGTNFTRASALKVYARWEAK